MSGEEIQKKIAEAYEAKADRLGVERNEYGQIPAIPFSDEEATAALED